jgi:hypothetical protein
MVALLSKRRYLKETLFESKPEPMRPRFSTGRQIRGCDVMEQAGHWPTTLIAPALTGIALMAPTQHPTQLTWLAQVKVMLTQYRVAAELAVCCRRVVNQ